MRFIQNGNVNTEVNSNKQSNKESWVNVVRRKQKQLLVVGSNKSETVTTKIKGVPKTVSLHVCRLSPDTKTDELISYLKPKYPEVNCEQLNSKQPNLYASFKVDIFEENLTSALDPNNWPKDACIRRFFYTYVESNQ